MAVTDDAGRVQIYGIDGSEPAAVPGEHLSVLQWTADGAGLYALRLGHPPVQVVGLDPVTGKQTPWLELMPIDPAGVRNISIAFLAADGRSYAYTYARFLSELVLLEGVR